jgi:nucleobase:cation symporter-1, NCS1 family
VLWACFLGFWLLEHGVVWRGVESIRRLQAFGAPFMFVMAAALLIWVRMKAGSFGAMLSTPSQFHSTGRFLSVFFPSLTAMVGYWATLALEHSRLHALFQIAKCAVVGTGVRAAGCDGALHISRHRGHVGFGGAVRQPIWDPVRTDRNVPSAVVAFVALIAVLVATLNVNIGANVVSPSNDFSNLYPRLISFRTGGLITGFPRPGDVPVEAAGDAGRVHLRLARGLLGAAGAVAGIMVCDYFFIRNTELDVNSLYHREGAYHYTKGVNPRAKQCDCARLGVGIALNRPVREAAAFPLRLRVVRRLLHGGETLTGGRSRR